MKVILTSTFDFTDREFQEVLDLLKFIPGSVTFVDGGAIDENIMKIICPHYLNSETLAFSEFWSITDKYRVLKGFGENDYVVLLTPKRNNLGWFSAFKKYNIFIDTNDWDFYTEKESKYGVAFSVVENLIQTLMNLDIDNYDPNIHEESIGCINDFCEEKVEIMYKLREGFICESCKQRIKSERINVPVISHLIYLVEYLRNQMVDNFSWMKEIEPEKVIVSEEGTLKIGETVINLREQLKSLYFLFLNISEGIPTLNLPSYQNTVSKIYYTLKYPEMTDKTYNHDSAKLQFDMIRMDEINKKSYSLLRDGFQSQKTKLNNEIRAILGLKMSEFYQVESVQISNMKVNKIKIEKKHIVLNEKFMIT
ncbi:hypothetical protein [Chryseobacterium sp. Hurlbut01]|uniref:hypothetical protein n=1 Tax=Chryseobacterium sp. Hurlbut01 TaxID=1681828 RepID=UPI00067BAA3F|nr:hypothetical protein [Chryseobacterium sp. Hurlbut01]KNB62264.1 hypothetical protein AC804_05215 [Chryseobacterium sp. Hurlbut01]